MRLCFFRDRSNCEVGGFGLLDLATGIITDFIPVKQEVTRTTVNLDQDAIADHVVDRCTGDKALTQEEAVRVWIHTHPMESVRPTETDLTLFEKSFGTCPWAIMVIVGKGDTMSARLSIRTGPFSITTDIGIETYTQAGLGAVGPWPELDTETPQWALEYDRLVRVEVDMSQGSNNSKLPVYAQIEEVSFSQDLEVLNRAYDIALAAMTTNKQGFVEEPYMGFQIVNPTPKQRVLWLRMWRLLKRASPQQVDEWGLLEEVDRGRALEIREELIGEGLILPFSEPTNPKGD